MLRNKNIGQYYDLPLYKGQVGLEIEVEGCNLPGNSEVCPIWRTEHDGSLRGESSEYVTCIPLKWGDVNNSLDYLYNTFNKIGSTIVPSIRCGIHVHLNFQGEDFHQLETFITLYRIYEPLLLRYCGPHRDGNMFCLGSHQAEGQDDIICEAFRTGNYHNLDTDYIRYSALNLTALSKYGSVEFRAFSTSEDVEQTKRDLGILKKLQHKAYHYGNSNNVLELHQDLRYHNLGCELDTFVNGLPDAEVKELLNLGFESAVSFYLHSQPEEVAEEQEVVENPAKIWVDEIEPKVEVNPMEWNFQLNDPLFGPRFRPVGEAIEDDDDDLEEDF